MRRSPQVRASRLAAAAGRQAIERGDVAEFVARRIRR